MRADAPVGDRKNMVFTGTTVTYGRGKAVVCATGMRTEFGKIAQEVAARRDGEDAARAAHRGDRQVARHHHSGDLRAGSGVSFGREMMQGTFKMTSILPMVMFAIALAVGRRSGGPGRDRHRRPRDRHARDGQAQRAGAQDARRRDPGLYQRHLLRQDRHPDQGRDDRAPASCRRPYDRGERRGYASEGSISGPMDDPALQLLLQAGVLASDAVIGQDGTRLFVKGDPTEGALVVVASKGGLKTEETRKGAPRVEEFPFSSERKRMTTIHAMPDGRLLAFMKGAPEVVLERCASFQSGSGTAPLDAAERTSLLAVNESMAKDALRVLGDRVQGVVEARPLFR